MKTPEEIKNALYNCTHGGCYKHECAYEDDGDCSGSVMKDALAYIEQLEEQIQLMRIQMQGDCGCCRHKAETELRAGCVSKPERPHLEYEGLPEVGG